MIRNTVAMIGAAALGGLALCTTALAQAPSQTAASTQSATTSQAAAPAPIPIEQLAAGDIVSAPSISPDGKQLVYITHVAGKPYVVTFDFAKQAARTILSGEANDFIVRYCFFKNDERVLCSFRGQTYEAGRPYTVTRLVAMNADGKKLKVLFQRGTADGYAAQNQDQILHMLPDDPESVLMQLDDDGDIFPSVFKVNVYTGGKRLVQRSRAPVLAWLTDRTGAVRFGYGYKSNETSAVYIERSSEDAPWRTLEKFHRFDDVKFSPLGYGSRPNTLLVSAPHDGRAAIWEMDLGATGDMQLLFSNTKADVDEALTWPGDKHLIGFAFDTDQPQHFYFDSLARGIDDALKTQLPGQFTSIIGGSRDGKRILIHARSDVKPGTYYVLDLNEKSLTPFSSVNPQLNKLAMAPMKSIRVPVGDEKIPGYLTLPLGREPKNLPTVVFPHGGPYARDTWGYDPLLQLMASRGYAVLQVNFRGSTGYGEEWFRAGWRGWGTVIHDDITASARWLVNEGIADPKRLCIVGASYGGYAALLGVVKEPELYRCAASIAGVSDLNELRVQDSFYYGGSVSARESIGADRKALKAVSPLGFAERVKVPVLLIHGKADSTVLASHSTTMAKALRKHDVPTELVLIEDADHYFLREEYRLTLYRTLEAFLAKNLSPN